MDKKTALISSIILIVIGITFFLERGYFANLILGATVLGNLAWSSGDAVKVNGIAIFGGLSFVVGLVLTITLVYKK